MHGDRAEPAGKAYTDSHHYLRHRTPKPSKVVHRVITSLVTMRWPIATGSSMGMVAFQIRDEFVRTSLDSASQAEKRSTTFTRATSSAGGSQASM